MREVFRMVESKTIYIVPVFISEGYFTQTVIPRELELEGPLTRRDGMEIHYCDPVGSHPRMTEVLLHRAREIAPNIPTETTSLFIVGHGTDLNDNSAKAAKEQASRIRGLGKYAEVISSYMEEPPLIADWHKISHQAKRRDRAVFHRGRASQLPRHPRPHRNRGRVGAGREPKCHFPAQPIHASRKEAFLCERHRHRAADR